MTIRLLVALVVASGCAPLRVEEAADMGNSRNVRIGNARTAVFVDGFNKPSDGGVSLISISATPATVALEALDTQQLTVVATYSDNSTATVTSSSTYGSSDPSATVSVGGLITGVSSGTATITVTYEGATDTVDVTVSETLVYDYTVGSIPSGTTAVTTGDRVYCRTGTTALTAVTPGSGVGMFENRGNGVGMLVAGAWKNGTVYDIGPAFWKKLQSWTHSGAGNITRTLDAVVTLPQGGTGWVKLTAFDNTVKSYIVADATTTFPGEAYATIWVRDYDGTPPTELGQWHGTANGAQQDDAMLGGTTAIELRVQGNNGGFGKLYVATTENDVTSPYGTGSVLVANAQIGGGRHYLPLIAPTNDLQATADASASEVKITDPTVFVTNGALNIGGRFQQIVDLPQDLIRAAGTPYRYLFSMETPDGLLYVRGRYASSFIEWEYGINGATIDTSTYTTGVTTPGVGGEYLTQVDWQFRHDANTNTGWFRLGFDGGYYTAFLDAGDVTASLSAPTSAWIHSNLGSNVLPGLIEQVSTSTADPAPQILLLGDSINDITAGGTTGIPSGESQNARAVNYVLTDAQVDAGWQIESLAVHGHKFSNQESAFTAFPWKSGIEAVIIMIGWNDFAETSITNATIRTRCISLLAAVRAALPTARIHLYTPTPGKAGVGASTYARWAEFRTDIQGSYAGYATYVDRFVDTAAVDLNDGSDNLSPDSTDHLHLNHSTKATLGEIYHDELVADGVL